MKKSLIVLMAVIIIGLVIALTYVLQKGMRPDEAPAETTTPAPISHTETPPKPAEDATTSDVFEASPIQVCAAKIKADTDRQGIKYEKGSILISFVNSLSLSDAKKELDKTAHTYSVESRASDGTQVWGTVNVTSGQEFVEICTFKQNADVKYAGINPTLDLHD